MKRLVVTWRKGLLIASMALVLALALWTALTATHHQHRALEQADMAFEAVHMTARDPARLAAFYTQVFGMPTAPGRAGLALPGTVAPVVLQLPGYEGAGPVLTLAPVAFYQQAVGGEPIGIERNYQGDFIARLTGVAGAEVHGRHVALPGYSPGGPTFEVFAYNRAAGIGPLGLDDLGRVATGIRVRDLNAAVARFTSAGGVVERRLDADRVLVQDRDGNRLALRQQVH